MGKGAKCIDACEQTFEQINRDACTLRIVLAEEKVTKIRSSGSLRTLAKRVFSV
jgi:hypothetical protein